MTDSTPDVTTRLAQYKEEWLAYVKRVDSRLERLETLKQGVELLVLVCAFLFYYLIVCLTQAITVV